MLRNGKEASISVHHRKRQTQAGAGQLYSSHRGVGGELATQIEAVTLNIDHDTWTKIARKSGLIVICRPATRVGISQGEPQILASSSLRYKRPVWPEADAVNRTRTRVKYTP